ncbi:MAG: tetratricopeptide repeat protein [Nevskia sp.]
MRARCNAPRFPLGLAFAVFGGLLFIAPVSAAPKTAETAASQQNGAQFQFHVLAGELAAGRNQPQVAASEFLQAVEISPNAELVARATSLALAANDAELALTAARKWLTIEPTSLEAREVIIRLSMRLGLTDDASAQCLAIVRDHPGGKDDGFRHVALLLAQEPRTGPAALALMAKLVSQYPKLAGAWQAQSLLALRFDEIETAEKSAREALRLQPNSKEAPLLLTGALIKKGDIAGSDQIVEAQVKTSPEPAELRLAYARLLIESDQRAAAREQLQKVLKGDGANTEVHFLLGLLALDERKIEEAEQHLAPLAKSGDRAVDAQYYLGRISEIRGQPAQALAHYEKVVSGNQALDAAVRRASMLSRLGHLPDARTTLDQLRQQYPPLATRFYLAEGDILLEAGEFDQAVDLYGMALNRHDGDTDLLYARSLVYERQNRVEPAEADLRAVLARNPNDARALNALGFMLVVHTARLAEAEKLIGRALELTPDEPAVIDSLGWLRFRQGRSGEAVTLLARAYERFPDPEVAAHFGEALWAIGDHDKAQLVWNRALQDAPDSAVLRATVKRLMP